MFELLPQTTNAYTSQKQNWKFTECFKTELEQFIALIGRDL